VSENFAFNTFTCYFGTRNINIVLFLVIISETANFDIFSFVKYSKILVHTKRPYSCHQTRFLIQNSTEIPFWLRLSSGFHWGAYSAPQAL